MADYFSAVHNNAGDDLASDPDLGAPPHVFTWLLPEHQECKHNPGQTVAVKADGQKLAFCEQCNLLVDPNRPGKSAKPSADFQQQSLGAGARP